MTSKLKLSRQEVRRALTAHGDGEWPLFFTLEVLVQFSGLKKKTIYEWKARGYLEGTYRKRGKYLIFWRDRLIAALFDGPEWGTASKTP